MRYFISIDVNDEKVRERIRAFTDRISSIGETTALSPENYHLTLLYIGEVDDNDVEGLRERFNRGMNCIERNSISCEINGVGVFPHMNYIQTVYIPVYPEDALNKLHVNICERMNYECRDDFVPHITIERVRDVDPEEKATLQQVLREASPSFGTIDVSNVRLKQSRLAADGPEYTDVEVRSL